LSAIIIARKEAMQPALDALARGDVVAIPTETVYGLAGDATNGAAIARIFEAKRRPRFNPLIAHVADIAMAERLVVFDEVSRELAMRFWPGPLTLVLPLRSDAGVHPLATAGLETLAVRMPRGFAHELITAFGKPLAAPSANSSGRISATTATHVADDLGGRIPLIVDGGPTSVGLESTIVKVERGALHLLRPGGLSAEAITSATGLPLIRDSSHGIQAPGMMASHYAPRAAMRLDATSVGPGEAWLGFGPAPVPAGAVASLNLSPAGDPVEAAANLFAYMQMLDRSGAKTIAAAPIPQTGLGEAINDRLARAAAPRDDAFPTD